MFLVFTLGTRTAPNSLSNYFLSSLQPTHSLKPFIVFSVISLLSLVFKVVGNPPIYRVCSPKFFPKLLIFQIRKAGVVVLVNGAAALTYIKW